MMEFFNQFIILFTVSAPWLLLGFLIAGLIQLLIPTDFLTRHLGNESNLAIVKASLIGAPLPLCSCGVVPTALGLKKAGASKSATLAFMVSTPETGVDSVSVSYALLGPVMAVVRPIAAIGSAIVTGLLVKMVGENDSTEALTPTEEKTSCCNKSAQEEPSANKQAQHKSTLDNILDSLKFSFNDLLDDIVNWLLIGLLIATAVQVWVPISFLTQWGDSVYTMILMTIIGIPMYICATASTPIAASLLFSGISPGAVLVFLLAGPATNIGTLGIIKNEFGLRSLVAYLSGVIISAIIFGLILDQVIAIYALELPTLDLHTHEVSLYEQVSAAVLFLLISRLLILKAIRH